MKAIILCAGKGTRVQEINKDLPKVLLPIAGKPMLIWDIELLKRYNIRDIAINTHWLAQKIKDYLGNGKKLGVNVHYSFESELLGTSGALNNFKNFLNEDFIVLYGDIIADINLNNLVNFHKKNKGIATIVVHKSNHPEDSDIIELNEKEEVKKIIHKPGNKNYGILGNAGLYILNPKIFEYIPEGESDFMKQVFVKALEMNERIYGYETEEFLKDAGTLERFKEVEEYLIKHDNFQNTPKD